MEKLLAAFVKSLNSFTAPSMLAVFIKSIIISIIILIGFAIGLTTAASFIASVFFSAETAAATPWIAGFGSFILILILFPGIMPLIISFFDTQIAEIIEQNDYPDAKPTSQNSLSAEILHDIKFAAKAIAINIIALPLYLFPLVNILVFYSLNGYLLGKEFFITIARRHLTLADAKLEYKRLSRPVFVSGVALTFLATIPIINLFAPFWAVTVMTHLFHTSRPEIKTLNPK